MPTTARYNEEDKLDELFADVRKLFKKVEGVDGKKTDAVLKEIGTKLQEAKTLIKDFEREARADGMPADELAARKKGRVQELNALIQRKKDLASANEAHAQLLADKKGKNERGVNDLSAQQLMDVGKKEIAATDEALIRAQRIVADTIEVGTKTAETLHGQTKQMERVMDDLDEIQFSMKKASSVLRDMTRGIATDRCIMFLMLVIIVAVVVIIILKVAGLGGKALSQIPVPTFTNAVPPPSQTPSAAPRSANVTKPYGDDYASGTTLVG